MNFSNDRPIYLQVIEDIISRIISGEIAEGEKLPSSRELAAYYRINPNTASRVYTELDRRGIAYTRRGIGTFVSEGQVDDLRREKVREMVAGFVNSMRGLSLSDSQIKAELLSYLQVEGDRSSDEKC